MGGAHPDPVIARATSGQPVADSPTLVSDGGSGMATLNTFRAVWMRKDPPVNTAYLYATYCLDLVDPQTTLVLNSPAGLRHANEKMYALQFPSVIPKTIVTGDKQRIREFVQQQGMAVLKPFGGQSREGILFYRRAIATSIP